MQRLLDEYRDSPENLKMSINDIRDKMPPPLAANFDHPEKSQAVEAIVRRYPEP